MVQQLGSGTTGYRGNPNKEFGPWRPSADVDFAIFSDQALVQASRAGVPVNPKITQGGRYTVFKNDRKLGGFHATPLGADLHRLAEAWNLRIFGRSDYEGFDFKLNLISKPFARALSVMKPEAADE